MRTPRPTILAATALLTLAACGGISVNSDWDPSFDFAGPQTFTLLPYGGGQELNRLNNNRVREAIVSVMESKGFREVADTTQADLAVGYQFTSEQRSTYETVNTGWSTYGYGGYRGWYGGYRGGVGMTTSRTTERRYEEGTLMIAVFDTEDREMVYHSSGTKTLADSPPEPVEAQRRITDAVTAILRDFPPGR